VGQRRLEPELTPGDEPPADPLDALEERIEAALARFEAGDSRSWPQVEELLTEGYGKLLSVEAICARLGRQLDEDGHDEADRQGTASRRELEEFHSRMLEDAARLRRSLGRFKSRGVEARGRFARPS